MNTCGGGNVQSFRRDQDIANTLPKSLCHGSDGAKAAFDILAQQASAFEELQNQVGDLQEDVPVVHLPSLGAVGMLEIESAVLLDVKSFILNFPSAACSLISQFIDGICTNGEVGKGPPRNNVYKYDAGILASGKTPARSISAWIRNERATRPEVKRPSQIGKVISWRPLSHTKCRCFRSFP